MGSTSSFYTIINDVYDAANHALRTVLSYLHTHQTDPQGGMLDHGLAMTPASLLDDDHTQYRLESEDHTHLSSGLQGGTLALDASTITSGRFGKTRLEWTANKVLLGAGAGADPTEINEPTSTIGTAVSENLRNSNDGEQSTNSVSYVKKKEMLLNAPLANCRIKFQLKTSNAAHTAYGRIYKNGVALGTEQSTTTTDYATSSEDFSGFASGDLIQIFIHSSSTSGICYTDFMRLYYDRRFTHLFGETLVTVIEVEGSESVTNQDPV